jgi:hypothetical protein
MSVTIKGTDTSAAAPSFTGSDGDTGMFFPAADTIAFAEGGAESMRIGSDGCLNIGKTDNPTGKLDIGGQASGVATNVARFGNIAGTNNGPIVSVDASNNWLFNQASGSIRVGSTIAVGGATALYGVGGITFPATQSASADANTLDDYEEGTWTPSITGATTYGSRIGLYTKIGNMVYAMWQIQGAIGGSPSGSNVNGLPFTSSSVSGTMRWGGSISNAQNFSSGGVMVMCEVGEGTTSIAFYGYNNAAGFTFANFASGSGGTSWFIQGSIAYRAA